MADDNLLHEPMNDEWLAFFNDMQLEVRDPATLSPHPDNPKNHPTAQREAFASLFEEVGWAGALLLNRRTNHLLDGHLRQEEALERGLPWVPVISIDVDEETERKILALKDPVGALFETKHDAFERLRDSISTRSDVLRKLLEQKDVSEDEPSAEPEQYPTPVELSLVPGEQYNYVMLVFRTAVDWVAAQDLLGITKKMCVFTKDVGLGHVVDGAEFLDRFLLNDDELQRRRNLERLATGRSMSVLEQLKKMGDS